MSMDHKAFAFDWNAFRTDRLHDILYEALESGMTSVLVAYINDHRESVRTPCEGAALEPDWQDSLENNDVQELGDYALTRFYDPCEDLGLGPCWTKAIETIPEAYHAIVLGGALGPKESPFDPGRQGSYFQTPEQVGVSRVQMELSESGWARLQGAPFEAYKCLLGDCLAKNVGVYVTF